MYVQNMYKLYEKVWHIKLFNCYSFQYEVN